MARVLYIEDDPDNRKLVAKVLERAGHEVLEADNGLDGVRLANEMNPDIVLVDIHIPDLDGYEVTLRLRGMENMQEVPIVAVTADVDPESSLAVGADGVITKPIDIHRFPDLIERYLSATQDRSEQGATDASRLRERTHRIVARLEEKVLELSQTNARLEEVARLRREFLQNVSHELATPMTPVVGYLRLLLNEELGPISDLQRKCLHSIESSTQRLRSVVDTLLDVSSLETGRMHYYEREYDFKDVALAAIEKVRERFESRDVTLITDLPKRPCMATGDPEKLERAMVHVLDNATKFTPIGGEVAVAVSASSQGDSYHFSVADSGPGVKPEHIAKILEPFYQVDGSVTREHGGVGLGLAFARRVTEALGGGIEISSPPAKSVVAKQLSGTLVELTVNAAPDMERQDTQ